jgi:cell division protein FtsB
MQRSCKIKSGDAKAIASKGGINMPKEKKDEIRMSFLFRCLLIAVLLFAIAFFATYLMKTNQLRQETEHIKAEITEREEHAAELRYLIDSPVDDAYIIRVAREKLGLVFPDEEVFYDGTVPSDKHN